MVMKIQDILQSKVIIAIKKIMKITRDAMYGVVNMIH